MPARRALTSSATVRTCSQGTPGPGIEVYAQFVRMVEIARPDGVGMEFDAAEVHDPGQAGGIVDNHLFRGTARGE